MRNLKTVYRTYFQNKVFVKLIGLFSAMTVLSVATFAFLMYSFLSESMVREELEKREKALLSVDEAISSKSDAARSLLTAVYRDAAIYSDLSALLSNRYNEYIRQRLERVYLYPGFGYPSVTRYVRHELDHDPDLIRIIVYSGRTEALYAFDRGGRTLYAEVSSSRSYIPDVMTNELPAVGIPNQWVLKAVGLYGDALFAVQLPIMEVSSLQPVGKLIFLYGPDTILNALEPEAREAEPSIRVFASDGRLLFPSAPADRGASLNESLPYSYAGTEGYHYTTLSNAADGYTVVGIVSDARMSEATRTIRISLAALSLLIIAMVISVSAWFIVRFSKRTDRIIGTMRQAQTGDITVRIADRQEDELGQISSSFNRMLDELQQYIDRVFKAEIKQKNAEMAALQARFNPHFLYNTLEVIRMRAISEGARDAGNMIYSMSALFRSFVKPNPRHTLRDELEHCRLYLELFRIRYKDKFRYEIDCEPGIKEIGLISTSLLPIVENYIVHGLRTETEDNLVTITAGKDGDGIRFRCSDNGVGIEPERLAWLRESLAGEAGPAESFGLRSVIERLRLFYGERAALTIDSQTGIGTTVTAWFPIE